MIAPQFTSADALWEFAQSYMPAGVGAGGRFNGSLGRPMFFVRGDGARLHGVDGREYLDFNLSHGATILGYNHPATRRGIEQALEMGVLAACETEYVARLAQRICEIIPCAEMVRFATSGMEATALAIRLARAATGREKIIKFEGHFHGFHTDVMFNTSGLPWSGPAPIPTRADSVGLPRAAGESLIVLPWNDGAALDQAFVRHGDEIAAVICEPINYNSGCIPAEREFLATLRALTERHESILIFDEVLSSFRMAVGGAQEYYHVTPDVCTLAKAVANGLPLAVIAGKREFMKMFSPEGPAAHSGTYSGHLFAVLASLVSLGEIAAPGFYDRIFSNAQRLYDGLTRLFDSHGVPARVQGLGARFGIYFGVTHEVKNYQDAARIDGELGYRFIRACFERGVYFHNYGKLALGHHGFSAAHTPADIDETQNRVESALGSLKGC